MLLLKRITTTSRFSLLPIPATSAGQRRRTFQIKRQVHQDQLWIPRLGGITTEEIVRELSFGVKAFLTSSVSMLLVGCGALAPSSELSPSCEDDQFWACIGGEGASRCFDTCSEQDKSCSEGRTCMGTSNPNQFLCVEDGVKTSIEARGNQVIEFECYYDRDDADPSE